MPALHEPVHGEIIEPRAHGCAPRGARRQCHDELIRLDLPHAYAFDGRKAGEEVNEEFMQKWHDRLRLPHKSQLEGMYFV